MAVRYGVVKTYSADNRMSITCPVFGAETELRACFHLDYKVMRGQAPAVRKGCQAAMRCSKCPIWHIKAEIARDGSDPYYSPEPRHGALSPSILGRIAPIVVLESVIESIGASDGEKAKLRECNEAARKGVRPAPVPTRQRIARSPVQAAPTLEPTAREALVDAAVTGNIAAAITSAVKESAA